MRELRSLPEQIAQDALLRRGEQRIGQPEPMVGGGTVLVEIPILGF